MTVLRGCVRACHAGSASVTRMSAGADAATQRDAPEPPALLWLSAMTARRSQARSQHATDSHDVLSIPTPREKRTHVPRHRTDPQRGPRRPPWRRQDHALRSPAACRRHHPGGRQHRARQHHLRLRPPGARPRPFHRRRHRRHRPPHGRWRAGPRQPGRHPRLSGLPRRGAVGAVGGGHGRRGRRRHHWNRPRHAPDHGPRGAPRAVPRDRGQPHRRRRRRLRKPAPRAARGIRRLRAAGQPARRRRHAGGGLLRRRRRRQRPRPGGGLAPPHPRPGGRGRRSGDGALSRRGRGLAGPAGAA